MRVPRAKRLFSSCIEVERKFRYTSETAERLMKAGQLLGKKTFTDVYWDVEGEFPLTTRDMWLRQRGCEWELKVPSHHYVHNNEQSDVYEEIVGSVAVGSHLLSKCSFLNQKMDKENNAVFIMNPHRFNMFPFAVITTERTSVQMSSNNHLRDIRVDLDVVNHNEYHIGECEIIIQSSELIQNADKKLHTFCSQFSLDTKPPIEGKVLHHLRIHRPHHYKVLQDCGLIQRKLFKKD